jgi:hypothetical protein
MAAAVRDFSTTIRLDAPAVDDLVLEKDGQKVLVDQVSLPFLSNAVIDFHRRVDRRALRDRKSERQVKLRLRDEFFAVTPSPRCVRALSPAPAELTGE